jgi:hypothetical protein
MYTFVSLYLSLFVHMNQLALQGILKRVHKIYNTCGTNLIVNYTVNLMFPTDEDADTEPLSAPKPLISL